MNSALGSTFKNPWMMSSKFSLLSTGIPKCNVVVVSSLVIRVAVTFITLCFPILGLCSDITACTAESSDDDEFTVPVPLMK